VKTLVAILLIMVACIEPVAAAPATPIWTISAGVDVVNKYYFVSDPNAVNWLFRPNEVNYLTAGATMGNGVRFTLGYGFGRNDTLGADHMVIAAVDKQLNENWWVTVGYQSGRSLFSGFAIGAAYNIAPNASVSLGYTAQGNDYDLKKGIIKTQLLIHF